MLRLPKPAKQDSDEIVHVQEQLQDVISRIETADDSEEQAALSNQANGLERQLNLLQSRHLLLAARAQGIDVNSSWLSTYSGLEWLTPEGRASIGSSLRRRRTDDWIKLVPMIISAVAIVVSIASAVATSRYSQQKDFLLNRSWLSANALLPSIPEATTQKEQLPPKGLSLQITNSGRAPALHVVAVGYASPANSDQSKFRSEIGRACSEASRVSSNGDFIPPGSSLTVPFQPTDVDGSLGPALIAGCIGYEDSLDHKRHATSFGFHSGRAVDDTAEIGGAAAWISYSLGNGIAN